MRMNLNLDFQIYLWRSKDGEEIGFFIETVDKIILIEAKMGHQNMTKFRLPSSMPAIANSREIIQLTVTMSGELNLSNLKDFLVPILGQK